MSVNGSGPRRRPAPRFSRRTRLAIGAATALLIGGVLVAPVVLLGGGSSSGSCARALTFHGDPYAARAVPAHAVVQAIAIGVGVASGCGAPPANVNVRSLAGIAPARAVGLASDSSSIYVRRGVCARAARLVACLTRS